MTEYIDLGKVVGDQGVSTRYRGDWLNDAAYVNDDQYIDLVTHVGCLWICGATNTGQEPSMTSEAWKLAARGMDDGADISDAISTLSVPSSYTEPTSGLTIKEHLSRTVRGLRNLFSNVGNLASLLTSEKGSLVGAINENQAAISTLNSNLARPVRDHLWTGSASVGQTITLSDSIYNYNWIAFANGTDAIRAVCPILSDTAITIRAGGSSPTTAGNIGSFGVNATISNGGKSIRIDLAGYITHIASGSHSTIAARTITDIRGVR